MKISRPLEDWMRRLEKVKNKAVTGKELLSPFVINGLQGRKSFVDQWYAKLIRNIEGKPNVN